MKYIINLKNRIEEYVFIVTIHRNNYAFFVFSFPLVFYRFLVPVKELESEKRSK